MTQPQYTERTHHGDFFSYRISQDDETFAEFMKRSPYYASDAVLHAAILAKLRVPVYGGTAQYGWSDFTMTDYPARQLVTVAWIERRRNSRYDNPRFRLHCDNGFYDTEPDASINYGIQNLTNSRIPETDILNGKPVTLVMNKRANVIHIERDGKSLGK